MSSARLFDYITFGNYADRPAAPDLGTQTLGIYFATDTNQLCLWIGTWVELDQSFLLSLNLTTPPTNGQVLVYDSTAGQWKPGAN